MWNWQKDKWPEFTWDEKLLYEKELEYSRYSGIFIGSSSHLEDAANKQLVVELLSNEALKTSVIEGEVLDRESVQSSIRKNFKIQTDNRRVKPAEKGISDLLTDLYCNFDAPLTHGTLFSWHKMITNGRYDLEDVGAYRSQNEQMQIISGRLDKPQVHFEAPPSSLVKSEMDRFIKWWHATSPSGNSPLPSLTRSAISHLYFVCIHPFEDGNGRIARALAEKALAENIGKASLIALSHIIEKKRKEYYKALEGNNKNLDITAWIIYFADIILSALTYSQMTVDFIIKKTKMLDSLRSLINERQLKVLLRVFEEGVEGFKGGLSAENYISISGASRATASRDLQDLVKKGALYKTGELKGSRYYLNI